MSYVKTIQMTDVDKARYLNVHEVQTISMILDNLCAIAKLNKPEMHAQPSHKYAWAFLKCYGFEVHIRCRRNKEAEVSLRIAADSGSVQLSEQKIAEILAIIARKDDG